MNPGLHIFVFWRAGAINDAAVYIKKVGRGGEGRRPKQREICVQVIVLIGAPLPRVFLLSLPVMAHYMPLKTL